MNYVKCLYNECLEKEKQLIVFKIKTPYKSWGKFLNGGAEGIRTPAPVTRSNGLANRPLEPLGYCSSICNYINIIFLNL